MTGLSLPEHIAAVLPVSTREAWLKVVPAVPDHAVLVGGTAIAVHLGHRLSRDLDFFCMRPFDEDELESELRKVGDFEPTLSEPGTLNGMFDRTKVQFLDAQAQRQIEDPEVVAGLRIAGIADLLAMKLKVIGDRGELRDYFDLMEIENRTSRRVEDGVNLYLTRYAPRTPEANVAHILEGLGYFDDVADDPGLPEAREVIERYWMRRHKQVLASQAKFGFS